MRVLLVGDLHLSDRPPSSCTDSYLEDLFELLYQVSEIAMERSDGVVFVGDIFHVKAPSRTSHRTVGRFIDWCRDLQSFGVPVGVVPGNHDIQNDRLDSLERQPLGVVFASGAAKQVSGRWDLAPVVGVPWPQDYTDREALRAALSQTRTGDLIVAHYPIYRPGLENPWECFPARDFADEVYAVAGGPVSVYYGHVHEAHGIYTAEGLAQVTFCNHGAIARGALHESELTRQIAVTLWDSETQTFTKIPLDAKPAEEVFRFIEIGQTKEAQERLDQFLSAVGETKLDVLSLEAVIDHVRNQGLEPDLVALVEELLAEAS